MNWELFSTIGYVSVALWLAVPVLWVLHVLIRPRRWLAHVAVAVAIAALVLAKLNSATYVNRIQVDYDKDIEAQMSRQELARKAAEQERAGDVADIRFAEDASGDFLDLGGVDNSTREYFDGFDDGAEPAWKKQKKERTEGGAPDDLESLIGASEEGEGVQVAEELEEKPVENPILMSDKDKVMADRLDAANLKAVQWVVLLALAFVVYDYFKRLNVRREAYFPLPVPSAWADTLTPRPSVTVLSEKDRRPLAEEMKRIARRGEVFIYFAGSPAQAAKVGGAMPRLPAGRWPVQVLRPGADAKMDDDFVFEMLWFARGCFVVDQPERAEPMLERFIELMNDRRSSRARTNRAVHIVWDLPTPIPESLGARLVSLGRATGFTLMFRQTPLPVEAHA